VQIGNATAANTLVTTATGAVNAQAAVESIQKDPVALAAATKAVESEWFALEQAAESSRDAARKFSVEYAANHNVRTVVFNLTFLEFLSLLLVLSRWPAGWPC
jgi:O-methyltransferase involved in polyketide biosynthesis